ncbi:MAG TPA: hypothetical protein VGC75_01975 [Candidatus Nitrosocosmicus sp.]
MECAIRKPYQGIINIIRFNRHFYLAAGFIFSFLVLARIFFFPALLLPVAAFLLAASVLISLIASYYIYDLSDLYKFNWLNNLEISKERIIANIHAGFDETSPLLFEKFGFTEMHVLDFYDPMKHTEISIKRARKTQKTYAGTKKITTSEISLQTSSVDIIFLFLSAHEIRNKKERILFFKKLRDCIHEEGKIIVVEHLRDIPNFLAFSIAYLHFYSRNEWLNTFKAAKLKMCSEYKINPFISAFILEKYGTAS